MKRTFGVAWFAAICAVTCCAQNKIGVVSAFSKGRQVVPAECQRQADVLWQTIQRYPHPDRWRWIVLCDEASWRRFLIKIDHADGSVYAATDLEGQVTGVRGTTLLRPDRARARPDQVIAHELAHIALRSSDEEAAERVSHQWLRARFGEIAFAER